VASATGSNSEGTVFVAIYDKNTNQLKNVVNKPITIKPVPEDNSIDITVTDAANSKLKVFLWNIVI